MHDFVTSGAALNASGTDADGTASRWDLVPNVAWGDVKIVKYETESLEHRFSLQVSEKLTKDTWNFFEYGQTFGGKTTQQVADREGVRYDEAEGAVKLYPRIEAQLRAKEVAFPGAGISFELANFALVIPFVVFASLVLLGYRARTAITNYSAEREPWI